MSERYLTSFEDQTTALSYTSGDATLVSPQVSLVGADEVVYSKEIPNESRIRFAKDEITGKLYFILDGVYYDALTLKKTKTSGITYGEVDLGLSVKWADRNVGAETPQDNGAYFSWGSTSGVSIVTDKWLEDDLIRVYLIQEEGIPDDTITQEMIDMVKLQYGENLKTAIDEYLNEHILNSGVTFDWKTAPYYSGVDDNDRPLFSKYNKTDGLTVLEAIDDAARVNMGSEWRMPTSAETLELVENTDHYYIDLSGNTVAGPFNYETSSSDKGLDGSKLRSICFVKKGEGFNYNNRSNFIEFPFAGYCFGSVLGFDGVIGMVWSSSLVDNEVKGARQFAFDNDGLIYVSAFYKERSNGLSVRGVHA